MSEYMETELNEYGQQMVEEIKKKHDFEKQIELLDKMLGTCDKIIEKLDEDES